MLLHNFLSFYFQTLMIFFMAYFALCNSFTLKVSKRKAYILAFICANFTPVTDSLAITFVGDGIIPCTETIYWLLKLINFISQVVMVYFIASVFEEEWYQCYWWAIIVQIVVSIPPAATYQVRFIKSITGKEIFRTIDLKSLPEYLLYLLITFAVGGICTFGGGWIKRIKIFNRVSKWWWYSIYSIWVVVIINSEKSYGSGDNSVYSRLSNIKQILLFVAIMFILIFLFINWSDKRLLQMEIDLLKQQNEVQYGNYMAMQQQETEIHKLYHDIGNHIETIRVLLNEGESREAKEYLKNLDVRYKDVRKNYYCSNKIINAVLIQKLKLCEQNHILCDTDIKLPETLPVCDIDLMSIFSNLMDNAIESCQRNNTDDNRIEVKAAIIGNYFTVKIINSKNPDSLIIEDMGQYLTWKKDKYFHGFGLKIIDEIIRRYDGEHEYTDNGNNFSAMVMLKLEL